MARGYGSNQQRGDYVIKLKGPCDIAVNRQQDGTFGLTTDWWDGHVEKEVGTSYGRLLQLYGVHKARIEAQKKGYSPAPDPQRRLAALQTHILVSIWCHYRTRFWGFLACLRERMTFDE